jgi:hypothetical protein
MPIDVQGDHASSNGGLYQTSRIAASQFRTLPNSAAERRTPPCATPSIDLSVLHQECSAKSRPAALLMLSC